MMRNKYISFLFFSFLWLACNSKKEADTLPESFLKSLSKQNFELLNPYLPTVEFYKSLGIKEPSRTDEEISDFIKQSKERLKEGWTRISEKIKTADIQLADVAIRETLVYDPFEDMKMQGMVVVYSYNNNTWDDISFIVSKWNGKTILLEIPNTERVLSMGDKSLRASSDARLSLEMNKPEFKQSLEDQANKIIGFARENKVKEFCEMLVYRGDDENRKWKSSINAGDAAEVQIAIGFMGRLNQYMDDCTGYSFNKIRKERESEGVWIVLPVTCPDKTIHFAFLKINDKFLLGDMDSDKSE